MNKKNNIGLSSGDNELLSSINLNFELAARLLGPEPAIYYEFNVNPELEISAASHVISQRQELFSKIVTVKPDKV